MKSGFVLGVGLLTLCGLVSAQGASPAQRPTVGKSDAQASFAALNRLAGVWAGTVTTTPHNPDLEGPIKVTLREGSRGTVLVHEIAPGGMPEPTMIYLEDDRLTLVHYCEAGNRPRLAARKPSDGKTVEFDFVDISGGTTPVYLNHFVFSIIDADHHIEDWTFQMAGDAKLVAHFDLKRAKDGAAVMRDR